MPLYNEVEFNRVSISQDGVKTTTFERVRIIRTIKVTEAQAADINAGRLAHPGNTVFTLFLAEGEPDPAPLVQPYALSGSKNQIDTVGQLSGLNQSRPVYPSGNKRR